MYVGARLIGVAYRSELNPDCRCPLCRARRLEGEPVGTREQRLTEALKETVEALSASLLTPRGVLALEKARAALR